MKLVVKNNLHSSWYNACLLSVQSKDSTPITLLQDFGVLVSDSVTRLQEKKLSSDDLITLNVFLLGVDTCIESRSNTALAAEYYLASLIHTGTLIQQWLYETKNIESNIKLFGRQKSIESDLTKILSKAANNEEPEVKDRFGFTCISYENKISKVYSFAEWFTGITTESRKGPFHEDKSEFFNWVLEHKRLSDIEKYQTERILKSHIHLRKSGNPHNNSGDNKFDPSKYPDVDIPKSVPFYFQYGFKDYIKEPKENSYQALQAVYDVSVSYWDIFEEILSTEILDARESRNYCNKMIIDDFKEVFPELSQDTLSRLSKVTSMRTSFPIEGHFKTKKMWDNPNASHEIHKSDTSEYRDIFTLSKKEVSKIKAEAKKHGTEFTFYDDKLLDPWGLHHAKFFNPEEHIYYKRM